MRISPTLIVAKLKRRKTGIFHSTAKLGRSASIVNLTDSNDSLTVGRHSQIDGEIIVHPGAQVSIGDFCYISKGTRVWAYSSITLENYVIIAHNVSIFDSTTHPIDFLERKRQITGQLTGQGFGSFDLRPLPILLEEGSWICTNAVILRGVTIRREQIVSASTIVSRTL
jgi:acetyltransferase-like isoleucine patch superfamily enzyme